MLQCACRELFVDLDSPCSKAEEAGRQSCLTCVQAYSPLGKGTREVLEDKTVSSVAQRHGRTNAQVSHLPGAMRPVFVAQRAAFGEDAAEMQLACSLPTPTV